MLMLAAAPPPDQPHRQGGLVFLLRPRPSAAHVHAVAAVILARSVAADAFPLPKRAPTPDNALAAGRPTSTTSVAAYLAVTALNVPQTAVARALGCARASVHQALRRVEMRRDEPEFDAALTAAEQELCPA
jgi:hypothetical protein